MRQPNLKLALVVVAAIASSGCATVVRVMRDKPAELNLASYKKIAIGNLNGNGGTELSGELAQALFNSNRFEVTSPHQMASMMGGLTAADPAFAARVAQSLGRSAIVGGMMSAHSFQDKVQSESGTCYEGGKSYSCTKYYRVGRARVAASLQLIDAETGKVLAMRKFESAKDNRTNADAGSTTPPGIDAEPLLADCRSEVIARFMKMIAPYQEEVRVELMSDGDLPDLEKGNEFAKGGNWASALERYSAAVAAADANAAIPAKKKAKAYYNLGVAQGYSGDYDRGIATLTKSASLNADENTDREIAKVRQFKTDEQRLKEQEAASQAAGGT